MTQARVRRWGNSLAIRIPKPFAVEVGLEKDSLVSLSIQDGKLMLNPIQEPGYTLEELLAGVTEESLHGEIDSGPAAGSEVW